MTEPMAPLMCVGVNTRAEGTPFLGKMCGVVKQVQGDLLGGETCASGAGGTRVQHIASASTVWRPPTSTCPWL